MLNSNITLNDSLAAPKTFVQNKLDGSTSVRIDQTTSLAAPRTMTIQHTAAGKAAATVDRHLVQFAHNETDSNGVSLAAIVNLTVSVPRSSSISRQEIDDLLAFVKNFISTSANVDAILRNES